jgi:Xaa-Pro aminopeptidase
LYYIGIHREQLAALIDADSGTTTLVGDELDIDHEIWAGPTPLLAELAEQSGITTVTPLSQLSQLLGEAQKKNRKVHYFPQFRAENTLALADYLGIKISELESQTSLELVRAIIDQRCIKSELEIQALEDTFQVTKEMHKTAMQAVRSGMRESELCANVEKVSSSHGCTTSYSTICTKHGQILHNHDHSNILKNGDLVLLDAGAESPFGYATDITRTFPVSGKFSTLQRDIYSIVCTAQKTGIEAVAPGKTYKEIHLAASKIVAEGLVDLGFLKGASEDIVAAGAHALFFPHGLGHLLGLDVHDMENLGEELVGYGKKQKRSRQFGLNYLRFAKELLPGMTLTVEPGIYFIPALMHKWHKENKHRQFVNYEKAESYGDFGGIRIEDDVLVTASGSRVLGKPIPKEIVEIEALMGGR